MTATRGTRCRSLDAGDVGDAVASVAGPVLDELAAADAPNQVALVPDVHYPYHASTGMTTNPAVVGELLATLGARRPDAEVLLAVRSDPAIDTRRTVDYLGYDEVADAHGAGIAVLDEAEMVETEAVDAETLDTGAVDTDPVDTETSGGRRAVPAPLAGAAVVLVPTARIDGSLPLFGSLALAARAVGADPSTPAAVARAVEAVDPAGAVVDATYAFTGKPARARALLAAADVATADSALARLLGVDPGSVPGLETAAATASASDRESASTGPAATGKSTVDGLDVDALAATLPEGGLPASTEPHPLVRAGYGLYTRLSGDVYPPQLEGDG